MFAGDRRIAVSRWSRWADESGVALITTLLVVMLITGLMAGMFAAISADQRSHATDRDQTQVYAAAHAGLEKLTADLAALFVTDFSPSADDLDLLTASGRLPDLEGYEFTEPGGAEGSGYTISWNEDGDGEPEAQADSTITAGAYEGFQGLLTRYDIVVTARSASGSEVRLRRGLQTVAVPVFQFGVFSEDDLTFYGGDDFDFGGRVHTNGNLWLSESAAASTGLVFSDRITAYGDVHRRFLSNGELVSTWGMTGPVRILTQIGNPASARTLRYTATNESSVSNAAAGFWNNANPRVWQANGATTTSGPPSWATVSGYYNGNISNRHTGATELRLPITSQGAVPIDLIKRPLVNSDEDTTNPLVFGQRYFGGPDTALRILLSDRIADITDLPTVTDATDPILLDGNWLAAAPMGYAAIDATHPPIANSIGPINSITPTAALGVGGTYVNPLSQIYSCIYTAPGACTVRGIDPAFLAPALTMNVTWAGGTSAITICSTRTITTFTGCTVGTAIPAGASNLTATLPSGLVVSTPTNGAAVAAGAGRTITLTAVAVTNPQPTARFVPGLIWVNGTAVTCEGYTTLVAAPGPRFTNCRGLTAAPGNSQMISTHALSTAGKGLIGGYLKIEKQDEDGDWTDVTLEILNFGIGAANQQGAPCGDPTPNAVLRIQRLRDNGNPATGAPAVCTYASSMDPRDWWPNALYDTREGNYRPGIATNSPMYLGGVMNYISLDVANLKRWFAGDIGTTGDEAKENNGYIVYFSDRRGDHSDAAGNPETGEYGSENFVNPTVAGGLPAVTCPAVVPQTGEDVNASGGNLDCYGETPHLLGVGEANWAAYAAPFNDTGRPWTTIAAADFPKARVNRQVLFRRALKLVSAGVAGGVTSLPVTGLTVVAENPIYVQGNYNATNDPVANPDEDHAPAAIMADAVAILSNAWTDAASFRFPNDATLRQASTTGYRFAVVTGKSLSFPYPTAGSPQFLFGTDGGAGNFLRMMENWRPAGVDLNYRGSMVSLFISRQATGTFKYHTTLPNVYDYADRNFKFDDEFLQPALLPPGTPMFRDVNMLTFRQILRPNQ